MKIKGLAAVGITLMALMVSVPAMAKPTYLACTLVLDGKPSRIDFTVDEQAGTASILITTSGHSRTVPATFTPDRVLIDEVQARWIIDRTNLSFSRTIKMLDATDTGTCKIQTPPKREF